MANFHGENLIKGERKFSFFLSHSNCMKPTKTKILQNSLFIFSIIDRFFVILHFEKGRQTS